MRGPRLDIWGNWLNSRVAPRSSSGADGGSAAQCARQRRPVAAGRYGYWGLAGEGGTVVVRGDADDAAEVGAEVAGAREAGVPGDALDTMVRGFQQFLGVTYPYSADPFHRALPGLCVEAPVERTDADVRSDGDVGEGEVTVRVLLDPDQHVLQRRGGVRGRVAHDELGLASGAVKRGDGNAGGIGCDGGSVVAPDQVEAKVQSRGGSGRGQDGAVVDVEHVRLDLHRRVSPL